MLSFFMLITGCFIFMVGMILDSYALTGFAVGLIFCAGMYYGIPAPN